MALLSVIRRWHCREQLLDPGDRAAHRPVAQHDPQVSARRTRSSRGSTFRSGRASSIRLPRSCRRWLQDGGGQVAQAAAHDQADACRSGGARLSTAPTTGSRPLPGTGRRIGSASSRPPAAAPSCRWPSRRARRSSSTGARTGPIIGGERTKLQVAHIKLSPQPGLPRCGPICCRPTRCCSTRITTPSACWVACRGAASTTT